MNAPKNFEWPDLSIDVQCWNDALAEFQRDKKPINYSLVAQRAQQLKQERTKDNA